MVKLQDSTEFENEYEDYGYGQDTQEDFDHDGYDGYDDYDEEGFTEYDESDFEEEE